MTTLFQVTFTPVKDSEGKVTGVLIIGTDISEQRELEHHGFHRRQGGQEVQHRLVMSQLVLGEAEEQRLQRRDREQAVGDDAVLRRHDE